MKIGTKRGIKGETYRLVVLKVLTKDELGRPATVQCGYDDTTFNLKGGEEFITAFIHDSAVAPITKARA